MAFEDVLTHLDARHSLIFIDMSVLNLISIDIHIFIEQGSKRASPHRGIKDNMKKKSKRKVIKVSL